jgi:hypothetical protein
MIWRARGKLELDDIPPIDPSDSVPLTVARLEDAWAMELRGDGAKGCAGLCCLSACLFRTREGGPSFLRALMRSFGVQGWSFCISLAGASCGRIASTILMGRLVRWFSVGGPWWSAVLTSLGMSCSILFVTTCHHHYYFYGWRKGLNARTGTVAFIYQAILKMRLSTLGKTTTGQVLTIASTDTERLQFFMMFAVFIVHSLVESVAIIACVGWQLGWAACVALVAVVALLLPVQFVFSKLFAKVRACGARAGCRRGCDPAHSASGAGGALTLPSPSSPPRRTTPAADADSEVHRRTRAHYVGDRERRRRAQDVRLGGGRATARGLRARA